MTDDYIQDLQDDVWGILSSDPSLCHVPVYRTRTPLPKDEDGNPIPGQATDINDDIDKALAGLNKKNGKGGIACIVMLPDAKPITQDSLGPSLDLDIMIRIWEMRIINEGREGTGITSTRLAVHILQTLHRRQVRGLGFLFAHPDRAIEETNLPDGLQTQDVRLRYTQQVAPLPMPPMPHLRAEGADLILSCGNGHAEIWYTTDGTWPLPGTALLYQEPFRLPLGNHVIRAVAIVPGMIPSHELCADVPVVA